MPLSITFNTYPASNRTPGVFSEIDNSQANTGGVNQRSLIVAQKTAAGTAAANVPVLSTGATSAKAQFGAGSMAALAVEHYRRTDSQGELWVLPVDDNGAGTAGTIAVTVAGTATAAGTLTLYVAGLAVQAAVSVGDTATVIAGKVVTAVTASSDLPVSAANAAGVVTLTAKNKGVVASDVLDVRPNYYGLANGEALPAGVTVSVAAATAGTGDPSLDAPLAALGDDEYDVVVHPFTGTAGMLSIKNFLRSRWQWDSQRYGGAFAATRGNLSALNTFGAANNDEHVSVLGVNNTPTPMFKVAAAYAAACAVSLRSDPALPLQYIDLDFIAPPPGSRFTRTERNTLLYGGVSTFTVNKAGVPQLERAISTYRVNGAGVVDNSYLDVETLYILQDLHRSLIVELGSKFARKKLVADGKRLPASSNTVTAQTVKFEAIAHYLRKEQQGIVQNSDAFVKQVKAVNQGNGTVALELPWDIANQLRVIVFRDVFRKS